MYVLTEGNKINILIPYDAWHSVNLPYRPLGDSRLNTLSYISKPRYFPQNTFIYFHQQITGTMH